MAKRNFLIFVILSSVVIITGIAYTLFDKKIYIPGYMVDSAKDGNFGGWAIIAMGIGMLLMGFFVKWLSNRENME
jgi:hypothetical protein